MARTLVSERLSAQARGSRVQWLARVSGATLRSGQGAIFDRMALIGVTDLRLVSVTEVAPPLSPQADEGVAWGVRATIDYGIDGFQTAPRSFTLDLSLKAAKGVPGTAVLVDSKPADRPQPWDLTGLQVLRSTQSLVLGVGPEALLDDVRRRADEARGRVAGVWGTAVPSVIIVPSTTADAARLLGVDPGGSSGALTGVAAVTDGPLTAGGPAGADRVVIVPGAWRSLTGTGRDVVLTHELTHVTVRATTTRAVPLWLSEGFAEYVAYRDVRLPESTIVAPLLEQVRQSGLPAGLPDAAAFAPANGALSTAYGEALCAVRTLVDLRGEAALVRLYRAAAGGLIPPHEQLGDSEAIIDDALLSTLGVSRGQLESDWRDRIRRLAGV